MPLDHDKPDEFYVLESLMVLIRLYGGDKTKPWWALDPRQDGLRACFNTQDHKNLRQTALQLQEKFHRAFFKTATFTKPDGSRLKKEVPDRTLYKDSAAVRAFWPETRVVCDALLTRLRKTDPAAAQNLDFYYNQAKRLHEPGSLSATQPVIPPQP